MSSIQSHLSNKPKQVFVNPINIFDTFTHSITLLYIFNKLFSFNVNFFNLQLCINFTNEMLQQHFNNNTFKLEEEIYVSEGITWDSIDFIDNEPMIELITKKRIGILPMLDEELKVPGGTGK